MAKFTATNHEITVTVDLGHEDVNLEECFQAFRSILVGLTFLDSQIDKHIVDMAEEIKA